MKKSRSGKKIPLHPEDLYKSPRTRNSGVTCLAFGENRKDLYPDYFFCHGCDMFEDAIRNGNKRAKRTQSRYACTAGHEFDGDSHNPTTLRKQYRPGNDNKKNAVRQSEKQEVVTHMTDTLDDGATTETWQLREEDNTMPARAVSSPQVVRSPVKKKIRRTRRWRSPNNKQEEQETRAGVVRRPSGDSHDTICDNENAMNARFVTALSFLDAAGTSDNEDEESMDYVSNLEKKNAILTERVYEVERTSSLQIAALKAEIVELNMRLATDEDSTTSSALLYTTTTATTGVVENDEDDVMEREINNNHTSENNYQRKQRIKMEDIEVSQVLSGIILDFFMTSELTADKRRFPDCRLARIAVDSVLAFEWVRCELANTRSTITAKLNEAMLANESAGNQHTRPSLDVLSLSALLNRKLRRLTDKRKAAILVECIWDDAFLQGEARLSMIERVRKHIRNHHFSPWKILKAMDLAGFNLSLAGIEVLRAVDGVNKYGRGFLPSKSSILRVARKVEASADDLCPFKMIGRAYEEDGTTNDTDFGEGFEFDVVKTTRTLLEAFGLMTDAKHRSIELSLTSDGAQLTNTLSHVTAGLKFNDVGMRNPFTKELMFLLEAGSLVQSRRWCFPLRVIIGKDNKKTLHGFRPLYGKFESGEVSTALGCRCFTMAYTGDMKQQWGALDSGGAAKVKEQFCYVCSCTSSSLHTPQDASKCELCKDKDGQRPCYHFKFLASPEVRGQLEDELAILTSLVDCSAVLNNPESHGERRRQRMYVRQPGQTAVDGDKFDIDYQPATVIDTAIFSSQVNRELASRSLNVTGPLVARQQRLREHLLNENRARELQHMLKHSEPRDKAMYLVLQAVVCILHLENRVGLKSIESVLRSGLSKAAHGNLDWTTSTGTKKRQEEYVHRVTDIMQTKILGTASAPSQWRFPLTDDGQMGSLSMDNNRTRATVNKIEGLIEVSFPDSDPNKAKLLRCFPHYRAAVVILRKNTDYTDAEISLFQEHIDAWFCDWINVYGKEGCTNYTHMLSSSHIMRYMQEWRCLHRYSQQGWEALNALVKSYFFRRTNRGGLAKNSTRKSKLLGIARWLQRRMMWYSGHGDALFKPEDCEDDDNHDDDNSTTTSDHESNDGRFDSDDDDQDDMASLMSSSSSDEDEEDEESCRD
jgi:hypothetical protein